MKLFKENKYTDLFVGPSFFFLIVYEDETKKTVEWQEEFTLPDEVLYFFRLNDD